jgi:transposase-like protein
MNPISRRVFTHEFKAEALKLGRKGDLKQIEVAKKWVFHQRRWVIGWQMSVLESSAEPSHFLPIKNAYAS